MIIGDIFFQSPLLQISTILHIVNILAKSIDEKINSINIEKDNFISSVLMIKCNYWNISVCNSSFLEDSWGGIWKVEDDKVGPKPSSLTFSEKWLTENGRARIKPEPVRSLDVKTLRHYKKIKLHTSIPMNIDEKMFDIILAVKSSNI